MASWTNATRAPVLAVLRPAATARQSSLRREYPVHPALQPFVERYWSVRWDRRGAAPYRSEVLTHPSVNLAVESGDAPRHGGHALPAALVHGVVTRQFVIDLTGWGRVTAVKFRPGWFRAYLGESVATDTVHRCADGDALVRAVLRPDDEDLRVAALDAVLAARVPEPDPEPGGGGGPGRPGHRARLVRPGPLQPRFPGDGRMHPVGVPRAGLNLMVD